MKNMIPKALFATLAIACGAQPSSTQKAQGGTPELTYRKPFGGKSDGKFDFKFPGITQSRVKVKRIILRHGTMIDGIGFKYTGGAGSKYAGGEGGREEKIDLDIDEHITRINLASGLVKCVPRFIGSCIPETEIHKIFTMQIVTNKRTTDIFGSREAARKANNRYLPAGAGRPLYHTRSDLPSEVGLACPKNQRLIGLHGRAGVSLNNVGIICTPIKFDPHSIPRWEKEECNQVNRYQAKKCRDAK